LFVRLRYSRNPYASSFADPPVEHELPELVAADYVGEEAHEMHSAEQAVLRFAAEPIAVDEAMASL
jgi:hypothetical protein